MDGMQVQVEYGPGKIRKFNIPDHPCTYEEMKGDIQCGIPSLVGKVFGIQYMDDERSWIIAIRDTCVKEAFRCAVQIEGTSMRRMKLRTFDGCSPQVQVNTRSTDNKNIDKPSMTPKCLFGVDDDTHSAPEKTDDSSFDTRQLPVTGRREKHVYRSPLQLLIDEIEDEDVKTVELDSANDHLKFLEAKFTNPNLKIDKTKTQCGQCHMRLGHTKRNCELGVCEGPQMCSDLDKHDVERKKVVDASTTVKTLTKDLEKLKQNLILKKQTYNSTCDSFFSRILPHLVNTNIEKYYPVGTFGIRQLAMGAIHPDIAVLVKHYRGIIPKDLDSASRYFQQILDKYQKSDKASKKGSSLNPIRRFMEESGVDFPNFKSSSTNSEYTTSVNSGTSFPCVPAFGYYPSYPMPMQFQMDPSHFVTGPRSFPNVSAVSGTSQDTSISRPIEDHNSDDETGIDVNRMNSLPPQKRPKYQ